nr:MAG TPA: hypothetical protein [Caudoviricetes sp.]
MRFYHISLLFTPTPPLSGFAGFLYGSLTCPY